MMRTPEEIAEDEMGSFIIRDGDVQETSASYIETVIIEAIEVDRAQRAERLVVSTRDRKVRTGVTENTVTDLTEIIAGYVADGYAYDELVIEGITE